MIRSRSILVLVAVALAPMGSALSSAEAQELPRSFASLRYLPAADSAAPRIIPLPLGDSTSIPKTYWLEGALIGGTVAGLLLGTLAGGLCSDPDSGGGSESCWDDTLLGAAFGFAAGGSLGALVGGQFNKRSKERDRADQQPEPLHQDSTESKR